MGAHYAIGGTAAIVDAFDRLFREVGGEVFLSLPVKRILIENHAACGVELADGTQTRADAVVSNADVLQNDRCARPTEIYESKTRMRYSMSLFVIYFGTKKQYPNIRHHTIILGRRYRELLKDIFDVKYSQTIFFVSAPPDGY